MADYLSMLEAELRGESYSKTEHRRMLRPLLDGRNDRAIDSKHMNISAVLIEMGLPYIEGYRPYRHYQRLLWEVIEGALQGHASLHSAAQESADKTVTAPNVDDILEALVDVPRSEAPGKVREVPEEEYRSSTGRKVDYVAREARNVSLGDAGEQFVLMFERARLRSLGCESLASRVERVAESLGDGVGFDVLSFEPDGRERFVEVKTTKYGSATPFFVTQPEVRFSAEEADRYRLYRVFSFSKRPRLFELVGSVRESCDLSVRSYVARPA